MSIIAGSDDFACPPVVSVYRNVGGGIKKGWQTVHNTKIFDAASLSNP